MMAALASADAVTWLSICIKAMVYATTLLAAGLVLILLSVRTLPEDEDRRLRRIAVLMAIASAVFSVLRLPIRASFLMGGTWAGAMDPMIFGIVLESPLGTAVALRLVGLGLILGIVSRNRFGRNSAALGTVFVAASFAMRGHALEDPRFLLGVLVTVHMLGLAFWLGAVLALLRLSWYSSPQATGAFAAEFGRKALLVVPVLVLAGVVTLLVLTGWGVALLSSAYSQFFAFKLALVAGILGFAAWNKLRLTPALHSGAPAAAAQMRVSLQLEAGLIAAVLLVTAALSTVSAP